MLQSTVNLTDPSEHMTSWSEAQWRQYMKTKGEKEYRGSQVFEYLHHEYGTPFSHMKRLPQNLRDQLAVYEIPLVKIVERYESKIDETIKYVYQCIDGSLIEGVLMKYDYGRTLCVSTQVGCAMGCAFCASTKSGRERNLLTYEMLSQVYAVENQEQITVSHVVLMGMGEPFDNWPAVKRFMELLHEPKGKHMSYRNMTISTCGIVPGIIALTQWDKPVTLAISLHAVDDQTRSQIMPINRRYPLEKILKSVDAYVAQTNRRVSFEFTVIPGVNDNMHSIDGLSRLFKHRLAHVNLIPLNPIEEYQGGKATLDVYEMAKRLEKAGVSVSVRRTLGPDIQASCGQLRRRNKKGTAV